MAADSEESERIRTAYAARDAAGSSVYRLANPAYQFHMQELEWEVLAILRRVDASVEGERLLEVGCGFGSILNRLLEFGAAGAVGVDLAEHRIAEARRQYPRCEFLVADGADLPFEDGSFGVVTQFVALSSVLDPSTRRRVGAEMWRVLAPGGVALSYDLRRSPRHVQMAGQIRAALAGGEPTGDRGTPTAPVSIDEVTQMLPGPAVARTVTLNFELAAVAERSVLLARLLARVPALRTHHLIAVRKPPE